MLYFSIDINVYPDGSVKIAGVSPNYDVDIDYLGAKEIADEIEETMDRLAFLQTIHLFITNHGLDLFNRTMVIHHGLPKNPERVNDLSLPQLNLLYKLEDIGYLAKLTPKG